MTGAAAADGGHGSPRALPALLSLPLGSPSPLRALGLRRVASVRLAPSRRFARHLCRHLAQRLCNRLASPPAAARQVPCGPYPPRGESPRHRQRGEPALRRRPPLRLPAQRAATRCRPAAAPPRAASARHRPGWRGAQGSSLAQADARRPAHRRGVGRGGRPSGGVGRRLGRAWRRAWRRRARGRARKGAWAAEEGLSSSGTPRGEPRGGPRGGPRAERWYPRRGRPDMARAAARRCCALRGRRVRDGRVAPATTPPPLRCGGHMVWMFCAATGR